MSEHFTLLAAGTANPALATAIALELGERRGRCVVDRFPDGEVAVEVLETIRRKGVFLVQPTSPPVNDHLMELLALADACRRTAAAQITALAALREQKPARVVVAVPTAAAETCRELLAEVDDVVCATTPEPFYSSVGLWYEDFSQTTDEEVRELLASATRADRAA